MTLDPIFTAGFAVQLHIAFALPSVALGPVVLFWLRPGMWHKRLGYAWVIAMAGLALSGFFIPSALGWLEWFGPLHLFSVLTLWSLWHGIALARAGNYRGHRAAFEALWFGGNGVAGLLNFIPGRTMNRAVLGPFADQGWLVIALGAAPLFPVWVKRNLTTVKLTRFSA
jgi:uncharacterized membrane protein